MPGHTVGFCGLVSKVPAVHFPSIWTALRIVTVEANVAVMAAIHMYTRLVKYAVDCW